MLNLASHHPVALPLNWCIFCTSCLVLQLGRQEDVPHVPGDCAGGPTVSRSSRTSTRKNDIRVKMPRAGPAGQEADRDTSGPQAVVLQVTAHLPGTLALNL